PGLKSRSAAVSCAIGGEADIGARRGRIDRGAIDPNRKWGAAFCCDARGSGPAIVSQRSFGVSPMRRRDLITLLGGVATWPLAARAQQAGKLPTIGFLGSSTLSEASPWVSAFVERLRELGWTEGRNVAMAFRWAGGRSERYSEIATEFVGLKVDVIVTF